MTDRHKGATDWSACPTRVRHPAFGSYSSCRCKPVCRHCGHGEHGAIHGPSLGQPVGSKPWGHQFEPEGEQDQPGGFATTEELAAVFGATRDEAKAVAVGLSRALGDTLHVVDDKEQSHD